MGLPKLEILYISHSTYGMYDKEVVEPLLRSLPGLKWFYGLGGQGSAAWFDETFPNIEYGMVEVEMGARAVARHHSEMMEQTWRESQRNTESANTNTESPMPQIENQSQTNKTDANPAPVITPLVHQPEPLSTQASFPPVTYPIYFAKTYPEMDREVIVYGIGYSADNLIAKFGINSRSHEPYRINIKEMIGEEAYQIAVKALTGFVMSNPASKYPQKLVIGENGILNSVLEQEI